MTKRKTILLTLIPLFLLVVATLWIQISRKRDESLLKKYRLEMEQYIFSNNIGLKTIFTKIFDEAIQCSITYPIPKECDKSIISKNIKGSLNGQIDQSIEIFFIRLALPHAIDLNSNDRRDVQSLYMTGETGGYSADTTINPEIGDVVELLEGRKTDAIFWDYGLPFGKGRRIIFPYTIDGRIVGGVALVIP